MSNIGGIILVVIQILLIVFMLFLSLGGRH